MAVTAYPVILIDFATGSDSAASGAGPATALTGSSASTDVGGTVVTLDGSPDLTGVATDGSHVIYLVDSTAGHRNFAAINAKDNGAKTVTVEQAFTGSLSGKSWAIGGKRASIGAASSKLLFDNNSTSGDAMPGWIVEMESGHSETIAATYGLRRAGDTTTGPIILRGASGAATRPIVTFSNNGIGLENRGDYQWFQDFELRNSNATKTASVAIQNQSGGVGVRLQGLVVSHSNKFYNGILVNSILSYGVIDSCVFSGLANSAIVGNAPWGNSIFSNNIFASCTSHGIQTGSTFLGVKFIGNLFIFNGGDGFRSTVASQAQMAFIGNVFHGNTSDGIELTANTLATTHQRLLVQNNILSYNGGYGINFSGGAITAAAVKAMLVTIRNNNFYANTSGLYTTNITNSINDSTVDPSSGNASATKDFAGTTAGTNFNQSVLTDLGYPSGGTAVAVGTTGGSQAYQDIGLGSRHAATNRQTIIQNIGTY